MKIVVTGALGHIGSALIRRLPEVSPAAEIVMLDNFLVQRYPSLFNLPEQGRYEFIEADVCEVELDAICRDATGVLHLAAITNAEASVGMGDAIERVNLTGTRRIAEACARVGAPLVFVSTTSVYGTQKALVDESCGPDDLKPQSPYAETKLREEVLLQELAATEGLRHITCRFGTIFGPSPGMRFHTAVNRFCWQAVMGQPLTVWRTALNQKRPYLDLDDAIRAFVFILERGLFPGEIFNVLTLNATVADIVAAIRKHVPGLQVSYVDSPIMNQLSYEVACEKFRNLGFAFSGDLDAKVGRTVDLLRQARSNCWE